MTTNSTNGLQGFKKIKLTQGKYALVDASDFINLSKFSWHVNDKGYACRGEAVYQNGVRVSSKTISMHRQILSARIGEYVDHINRKTLDNRRSNLRLCTPGENRHNSKTNKNNHCRVRGVYRRSQKRPSPWRAQISFGGKQITLGAFKTRSAAAKAYRDAAIKMYGGFSCRK